MKVRMGLIWKRPDWSQEEFSAYWRDRHGPIAAKVSKLREYWQNVVTDRIQRGITFQRGPWDFDGVSQLCFDEVSQSDQGFRDGELAAALVRDEAHFIGGLHIITADRAVVVDVPPERRATLLKRISTLKRRPDISEEDFRREWRVHADHVRRMPGVAGYRQNVVLARERIKGQPCGYDDLPIDGVVELWFEDPKVLDEAFASPEGRVTMKHAESFLHEITAFVVQERRVV